jgi:glycosyltransferase involved in cell wall biosynthesis
VRQWVRALGWPADRLTVVHLEMTEPEDPRSPSSQDQPEGRVLWVPVKVGHRLARAAAARAQAQAITGEPAAAIKAASTVFAHVTMPTGVAVLDHLDPSQRFILAEHASYLPQLLARTDARPLYGRAVDRAGSVLAAGEATAALIREAFPQAAAKVWAVGNPLDPDEFTLAGHPVGRPLKHWLYVGNLLASKGVFAVLESFAAYVGAGGLEEARPGAVAGRVGGDSGPHLTLVGEGLDRAALEERAKELGLANQVSFLGSLTGPAVARAMAAADLQVHLSPGETFGLAPLEGLLSGLPLVAAWNDGTAQTLGPAVAAGRAVVIDPPKGKRGAKAVVTAVRRLEEQRDGAKAGGLGGCWTTPSACVDAGKAELSPAETQQTDTVGAPRSLLPDRLLGGCWTTPSACVDAGKAELSPAETQQTNTVSAAQSVRQALLRRYGLASFGAMERRVVAGVAPFAEPGPRTPEPAANAGDQTGSRLLVAVAGTRRGWTELAEPVRQALLNRRRVTVIFADPALAAQLDPRIEAIQSADPFPLATALERLPQRLAPGNRFQRLFPGHRAARLAAAARRLAPSRRAALEAARRVSQITGAEGPGSRGAAAGANAGVEVIFAAADPPAFARALKAVRPA